MLVVLFCLDIGLSRQVLVGFGAGEDNHPRLAKASLSPEDVNRRTSSPSRRHLQIEVSQASPRA